MSTNFNLINNSCSIDSKLKLYQEKSKTQKISKNFEESYFEKINECNFDEDLVTRNFGCLISCEVPVFDSQ